MRPAGAPQTHLGEEPPPLPDARPEVGGAAPLRDLHGLRLPLPLGDGPVGRGSRQPSRRGRAGPLPAHSPDLAPGFFPELRSSSMTSPGTVSPPPPPSRRSRTSAEFLAVTSREGAADLWWGEAGAAARASESPSWATKTWMCEGWGIPDTGYLEERKCWEQRAEAVRSAAQTAGRLPDGPGTAG